MVVRCPQLLLSDVRNVVVPSLEYFLRCTFDHKDLGRRLLKDPGLLVVRIAHIDDSPMTEKLQNSHILTTDRYRSTADQLQNCHRSTTDKLTTEISTADQSQIDGKSTAD